MPAHLHTVCDYFCTTKGKLRRCFRDWSAKRKIFTIWPFRSSWLSLLFMIVRAYLFSLTSSALPSTHSFPGALVFLLFPNKPSFSCLRTFALAILSVQNTFPHDFHMWPSFCTSGLRSNANSLGRSSTISFSKRAPIRPPIHSSTFFFWHM